VLVPLAAALAACDEGPAENAGEAVDDAATLTSPLVEAAAEAGLAATVR
jgi:hypothetical protein